MKVYGKKPNTLCGQHVNASHLGTQVLQTVVRRVKRELAFHNHTLVAGANCGAFTIEIFE
jgi:hypothetical protein